MRLVSSLTVDPGVRERARALGVDTAAWRAADNLVACGWDIRVWGADTCAYPGGAGPHLNVSGRDPHGDRFYGVIDQAGTLTGEPADD